MLAIFNSRIRIVGGRDWTSDSNIIPMATCGGNLSTVEPIIFTHATGPAILSFDPAIHAEREAWSDRVGSDMQVGCHSTVHFVLYTHKCSGQPSDNVKKHQDTAAAETV